MNQLRIVIVQQDFPVGDIAGNVKRIKSAITQSESLSPDLLLFPELAITGYPPEDLLYRGGFMDASNAALDEIVKMSSTSCDLLVGHPMVEADRRYNAVSYLRDGAIVGQYRKQALPNYAVFDEKRYFDAGDQALTVETNGVKVGVLICEDIWEAEPAQRAARDGCDIIVVPNASPYHLDKRDRREAALKLRAAQTGKPIVYGNLIGGQDELVFDGRSCAVQADGDIVGPTPLYSDGLFAIDFDGDRWQADWAVAEPENALEAIYQTLVRGTRDYVRKSGFKSALLGLSGGIDSGLVATIAADALGAENVHAVMMPSQYTSQLSLDLAKEQADLLGLQYDNIAIQDSFDALLASLQPAFADKPADLTEENLQARIRGNILMALSNKHGALVMATSNKSETAVGYATIYGDMCGAYSPIKDCAKLLVYQLADYRNSLSPAIPQGVIDRPPSAELRPDQKDSDSLPPYEILDEIIARYVEQDQSINDIVAAGFDEAVVRKIARLVLINEYKRRQSAPGCRITPRAFGRDRRYPIVNSWRDKG